MSVHFWAPTFKWGISIANIADFQKPPETLSYPQQIGILTLSLLAIFFLLVSMTMCELLCLYDASSYAFIVSPSLNLLTVFVCYIYCISDHRHWTCLVTLQHCNYSGMFSANHHLIIYYILLCSCTNMLDDYWFLLMLV